jgi:adenylate cyclase class 2
MAVEIETKIKVDDLGAIRAKLQGANAKLLGRHLEINTFFDTEDRSLLAADKGLRVRVSHDTDRNTNECTLTFKGPRQPGQLKSREENETTIGKPDCTIQLLEALGFKAVLTFEKRRESWELLGCRVELDELPHLGTFVEIEGPKEEMILNVERMLGLSGRSSIRASYAGMLMTHLQETDSSERTVIFPRGGDARCDTGGIN